MNKIKTIKSELLNNLQGVTHHFFTRSGGVSQNEYASLNVSYCGGDNPDHVKENRRLITHFLGAPENALILNKQTHSAEAMFVEGPMATREFSDADGLVTKTPGLFLGAMGADCPPVLFCDPVAKIVGAAHAGWKGAKSGILESTVKLMVEKGAELERIHVAIGPCIAQNAYEIDAGFYDAFINDDAGNVRYFVPSVKPTHYMFDLRQYCADRLSKAGIKHLDVLQNDTYTEPTLFFSNRRSFHMGERKYGVCVHVIGLQI